MQQQQPDVKESLTIMLATCSVSPSLADKFAPAPRARAGVGDLIELLAAPGSPEVHGAQLASAVREVLSAQHCSITLYGEGDDQVTRARVYASSGDDARLGSPPLPDQAHQDGRVAFAPICYEGQDIGVLRIARADSHPIFDQHDLELTEIVTCFLGRSLQVTHMRNLLKSRFARVALAGNAGFENVDAMLRPASCPDQMVKLLARSFYREMRKAGFESPQIISAASEIISQLTDNLKKG